MLKHFSSLNENTECETREELTDGKSEYVGLFDLKTLKMTEGDLPKRAQEMIEEWLVLHQADLQEMWDRQEIKKLPPL